MARVPNHVAKIKHLSGDRYKVQSATHPDVFYEVDISEGSCTCPMGKRGGGCKHVEWVHAALRAENSGGKGNEKTVGLGFRFDEVTSALQKEIRKGDEEAAVYWALLLHAKAPAYCWKRVLITAAEDIGLAAPEVVTTVGVLAQMYRLAKENAWHVSPHHLTMAVMLLCRAEKSTEVEDLQSLTQELIKREHRRPMPEYALDAHTAVGKARKAGWDEWYHSRHFTFGIPINKYTERLWKLFPDWMPKELRPQSGLFPGDKSER